MMDYGAVMQVPIDMGPDAWYTVHGDGKGGGAKLRAEAAFKSAKAGTAPVGTEVRVDLVEDVGENKLRAHICEPAECVGWTTVHLLRCRSKQCGRCVDCGQDRSLAHVTSHPGPDAPRPCTVCQAT
jgi:hypothetical protein